MKKSRKVMRGGNDGYDFTKFDNDKINNAINEYNSRKGPSDQVKLGEILSDTNKINDFTKSGIMLILNPSF